MTASSPYLERLRTRNPSHPSLELLDTLSQATLRGQSEVAVLEVTAGHISSPRHFANEKQLETYLAASLTQDQGSETSEDVVKGRIFLVQNLAFSTLSMLGQWFDIDPLFFASYLKFEPDRTQNFATGYHTMRPPMAPSPWSFPASSSASSPGSDTYRKERRTTSRPKDIPKLNHATFVYHEIRSFDGKKGQSVPRKEKYEIRTADNVRRLVTTVEIWGQRVVVGLVRRNLSVWWGWRRKRTRGTGNDTETEDKDQVWDTILLLDPPIADEYHIRPWGDSGANWIPVQCRSSVYLGGYMDLSTWPDFCSSGFEGGTTYCGDPSRDFRHLSAYQAPTEPIHDPQLHSAFPAAGSNPLSLLSLIMDRLSQSPQNTLTHPQLAAVPALTILVARWTLQLDFLIATVSELEKGLLKFEQMDPYPDQHSIHREAEVLRGLLSDVNGWRRRLFFYEEQGLWNMDNLGVEASSSLNRNDGDIYPEYGIQNTGEHPCCCRATHHKDSQEYPWATFHQSFNRLQPHLHLVTTRLQSLLPVVMGAFSLLEARQSLIKEDLTIKLSGVALLYVPLSFTASLLGMSDEFVPGKRLFWVFFVVAIPMIGTLFWWGFWAQVGRARRWVGRRVGVSSSRRGE